MNIHREELLDGEGNPPEDLQFEGICLIGYPVVVESIGEFKNTFCGPNLNCPNQTYCNTRLLDTYSTCCLSDPENPVKPGNCTASQRGSDTYCLIACNNDGDCTGNKKCCQKGCSRECILPP
ncbi:anosmin-1 [Plakobranchus ocellatus]|uniref:Anosmin-1 n=1 Tax=Plakobranchus ocellatus TaxID=259542 RepID=A0AAV4AR79_9GAST|nr:anosmin-1 [Plakobranchus ocellatus]